MIWLWTALLVAGVAVLAYTLTRVFAGGLLDGSTSRSRPAGPPVAQEAEPSAPSRARQILDERYAAGGLSTEEYEHRRAGRARAAEQQRRASGGPAAAR